MNRHDQRRNSPQHIIIRMSKIQRKNPKNRRKVTAHIHTQIKAFHLSRHCIKLLMEYFTRREKVERLLHMNT